MLKLKYVLNCDCYRRIKKGKSGEGVVVKNSHGCTYSNNGRFAGRLIVHSLVEYNAPTSTIY